MRDLTMRFRASLITLIAVFLGLSLARLGNAGARTPSSVGATHTPVLIELFTSEGCSSCPPADALLERLDRSQPVPTADLVVLSEHVDYWNDIRWKDPYSSPAFSIRQGDYARRFHLDGPYTPQMVVDGNMELVGSDERRAIQVIQGAAKVAKLPVSVSSLRLEAANTLALHVEVGPPFSSAKPTAGRVWIALADDSDQSSVRGGENKGRVLKHVAVLRALTQVGTIDSGAFSKDVRVNTENANLQNLRVVAIVQETPAGRVLGLGSARLSN
jgi:hypothetical protein